MTTLRSVVRFELPPLGYGYDALEPACSAELLELHHAGHHQAYVDGANGASEALRDLRAAGDFARIDQLEKDLAFNLAGHVLHTMMWRNLAPNDGAPPAGRLLTLIREAFGSVEALRRQFHAAGTALQGAGWVALSWETARCALVVEQIHEHRRNRGASTLPLLVMDMWEHAYYLQHRNRKERWIVSFWDLVNWGDVSRRLEGVSRADLALEPAATAPARGVVAPFRKKR
jgi:Fe-Mn family superoxide dismutase